MRVLIAVAVAVAALALPLGASADPKPAGCAGVVQVTGNQCMFTVEAGNDGVVSYALVHSASDTTTSRIDLLRGTTVVYTSGNTTGEANIAGLFRDQGVPLPAGTYRCRVTATGPVIVSAYQCTVA
ncbi:MAG: hypothetical protein ACRDJM_04875 [Actinomycetota bacterium]